MFKAIAENDLNQVMLLINKVNCRNLIKSTPLHEACYNGNLDIIKCLIENGAYINSTNLFGNTPLCFACNGGYFKIIKFIKKQILI